MATTMVVEPLETTSLAELNRLRPLVRLRSTLETPTRGEKSYFNSLLEVSHVTSVSDKEDSLRAYTVRICDGLRVCLPPARIKTSFSARRGRSPLAVAPHLRRSTSAMGGYLML
jgi:hypothetical protein